MTEKLKLLYIWTLSFFIISLLCIPNFLCSHCCASDFCEFFRFPEEGKFMYFVMRGERDCWMPEKNFILHF